MQTRHVVLWVAIALLAVDLLFFSGASNFLAAPQSRILNQVLVLGAMVGLGIGVWRGSVDVRSPLIVPGLAWIGAAALSTLLSDRPAISLEGLALLLLAAPAYLAVRAVVSIDWLRDRVDRLVVVATSVFVVAYLLQATTQWISWWSIAGPSVPPLRPGDVGLTVGTVNAVALYLETLAPLAIVLAWVRWRRRSVSLALGVLSLVALVVTGSRGAWLGALAGFLAFGILAWFAAGRPRPRVFTSGRRTAAFATAGAIGVLLVVLGAPVLLPRLLAGDAGRFELWSAAWSMFAGDPIGGVGLGGWPDARADTPISMATLAVLTTAHNSVLQVLAETGIVGLLAGTWLAIAVFRTGWHAVARSADDQTRVVRLVCLASLIAVAVHSLFDTQFHLLAVVLLVMHLVARLDPPPVTPVRRDRQRQALLVGSAMVLIGAGMLVPIDIAMLRGQIGNLALDRGDAATAAAEFDAAVALHELPSYRLGEAIAKGQLGDRPGAQAAIERLDALAPFTFAAVQRALVESDLDARAALMDRIVAAGPYDPTVMVNLAAMRFASDPVRAAAELGSAMSAAPTLVYSDRPSTLFDDGTWAMAQAQAIEAIGAGDPAMAAALAILADRPEDAAAQRAKVADPAIDEALDRLVMAAGSGGFDFEGSMRLLRANAASPTLQGILWLLAFEAESQPLIDAVRAVAVPAYFGTPLPPMELVIGGSAAADYSLRLPRWPVAETSRQAPKRPYIDDMITIEPVFRPKP